jgi:hypothetical protein
MQNARKSIAAAAVPLIAAAAMWIATGQLNAPEFATALSGLLMAILVYAVPNAVTTGESGHDPNLRR